MNLNINYFVNLFTDSNEKISVYLSKNIINIVLYTLEGEFPYFGI